MANAMYVLCGELEQETGPGLRFSIPPSILLPGEAVF